MKRQQTSPALPPSPLATVHRLFRGRYAVAVVVASMFAAALAPVALVPDQAQPEQASYPDQSDLTEKAEPATGDAPPPVPEGETVVTEVPGQPVAPAMAAVAE